MKIREIVEILNANVLAGEDSLELMVNSAFASDLMSDVLAFATPGSVLLTGLTTPQIVRTSDVSDIAAIILVRGKKPPQETIALAQELGIPLLATTYIMFEAAGRLFQHGLTGSVQRVTNRGV